MPIKVVVSGATGRMGQTLARLIADSATLVAAGGIDQDEVALPAAEAYGYPAIATATTAGGLIRAADVVLDFSAPLGLHALLTECAPDLAGKALVVGTTGLTADVQQLLDELAQRCAVITAANFSVAANLMLGLTEAAARVLAGDRYDVEIVETHHRHKADAPSGTALALARAIAAARGIALDAVRRDGRSGTTGARPAGEIGMHALRGGEIVGEHSVQFIGTRDRFELSHVALDRALFAEGALVAAEWVHGKPPGRYTMKQVLGLETGD